MIFDFLGIRLNLKKEVIIAGAAALILLGCITGWLIVRDNSDIIVETGGQTQTDPVGVSSNAASEDSASPAADTGAFAAASVWIEKSDEIKVYVTGCVRKPGIVTLEKGQLIDDAIRLAGGATAEADLDGINLVYELRENLMLYIRPKDGDGQSGMGQDAADVAGKGVKVVKDSGGAVVNESKGEASPGGLININTASAEELDKLPGVGEATAGDIIAWRESNGPFKTIQDIMKVPRIKESRFNSIKDLITVD